jgi:hypothetical protein
MSTKKIVLAIVAGFVLLAVGRFLIHGLWLAGVYAENAALWRTPIAMQQRLWVIQLANLILATGAALIYVRGVEPKPWLGQGIRFGILLALVTGVPQSMVEYFTYPIPSTLAFQWIIGEGGLALLLGVLVAAICRPQASA